MITVAMETPVLKMAPVDLFSQILVKNQEWAEQLAFSFSFPKPHTTNHEFHEFLSNLNIYYKVMFGLLELSVIAGSDANMAAKWTDFTLWLRILLLYNPFLICGFVKISQMCCEVMPLELKR